VERKNRIASVFYQRFLRFYVTDITDICNYPKYGLANEVDSGYFYKKIKPMATELSNKSTKNEILEAYESLLKRVSRGRPAVPLV